MDSICEKIRSEWVKPIGLKELELNYLYLSLVEGTSLVIGEGGEGGVEGVSATIAASDKNRGVIDCVDMCPCPPGSYLDRAVLAGTHRFVNMDFTKFPEDKLYDNVVCINVLEHFGFDPDNGTINLNYDLLGLKKMMKVCAKRIILTIPYSWRCLIDDHITTCHSYTPERMQLLYREIYTNGFKLVENAIVRNVDCHFSFDIISEEKFAKVSMQEPYKHEYLRSMMIDRATQ